MKPPHSGSRVSCLTVRPLVGRDSEERLEYLGAVVTFEASH